MYDRDALSNLILVHWQSFSPAMYSQLQKSNRLQEALNETCEEMTDFLHQLITLEKMEHHRAWELAIDRFFTTEESP
jgi:hypothetical protein